jgi:serine/threonine-protein kinase
MFLSAPKDVTVPSLIKLDETEARQRLDQAGLLMEVAAREPSDLHKEGVVFKMQPFPGVAVKQGKPVRVWISKGPPPVVVPDVGGASLSKARASIRAKGLVVGEISEEYNETISKGEVISQMPAAGQEVAKLTSVSLIVSKGPEPVAEPEVVVPPEDMVTPTPAPGEEPRDRSFDVDVEVPRDSKKTSTMLRITVTDANGEREVLRESRRPGERVKVPVDAYGRTGEVAIRVYTDDQLYSEKVQ